MSVFHSKINIKGDQVIWAVVFILTILSFLAVYSSTGTLAYKYHGGNTAYYMLKHGIILLTGLLLMYLAHLLKYTYYSRIFQIAFYIAVPLLLLTLLFGLNLNEARRALPLPFHLSFETSDLAKLTLTVYLARILTKKEEEIKDFGKVLLYLMLPVVIVCGLIFPANFSTAALIFVSSLVLIYIGRVKFSYILAILGLTVLLLGFAIGILFMMPAGKQARLATWKTRIEQYVKGGDAKDNYQVEQAKIAIASGGIFGKMPGKSTQRNFLPHPYSDFIYAIIVEEYGLLGGTVVVLLYLILLYRAVRIVTKVPNNFGAYLAMGLSFSLVFQAMINMGVAVHLLPVTGQPLPLVSMGGTSIWFTSLSIGILLSVSKEIETNNTETEPEPVAS
ncbi:FtsW/RodA/SpoVE family cell cycle protein [Candidatus Sulfidibacterium hydrothermale]|uniref:FtsW/RodA/SpoVE family cell cycle protein n=1 Tax=Candidatus Sulfidibacterium hydrothermale TaxID=2875962 RepID=UPI001F0B30EC|nr:FtsW/RodA/SpoVE family cell cycle protein [Candidatus Sulfidibacterium hydrothermale]UBM63062.1 FtsW/RodA/SpoVE family cell cycle protein [Candidatus Sulfidibacterium hydrothermale]